MKIGILSQWYDPEPGPASLPGVLARELVRRGHEVKVLTGFPNYPTGELAEGYKLSSKQTETLNGVEVTRTFLLPQHNSSGIGRILNYFSFGISASIFGRSALKDIDVLWVNYSPITVAFPMWIQKVSRKTPIVCEVADLWPDTVTVAGLSGSSQIAKFTTPLLSAWTNAMYRVSTAVVHISPGVGPALVQRGVPKSKIRYVPKPADEINFHTRGSANRLDFGLSEDDIVVLYAGSMGTAQGLTTLLEAVAKVPSPNLKVLLVGSGTEESTLRQLAAGDERVQFLGRQPTENMAGLLAMADVAYIGLADHPLSHVTMPSKTQSILASGKAVLVAATGDVSDLIENSNVGFAVAPGDSRKIAEVLQNLVEIGREGLAEHGSRARKLYEDRFSVASTTDEIESILQEVTSDSGSMGRIGPIDSSDIYDLAKQHRAAFPDFFLSKLGERFLREFYRGFISDPKALTTVVRDESGRVLGAAVGTADPNGFFKRLLKRRWMGFALASASYVLHSPRETLRLVRAITYRGGASVQPGAALLSSIFVAPTAQGKSLGRDLLEDWTRKAAATGANVANLSTDALNNDRVRSFYEKSGWSTDHEYTTPEGRQMVQYEFDLTKVVDSENLTTELEN